MIIMRYKMIDLEAHHACLLLHTGSRMMSEGVYRRSTAIVENLLMTDTQ